MDYRIRLEEFISDFIQNWLEDNISPDLYKNGLDTAEKYKNTELFKESVVDKFLGYFSTRVEIFETELNKQQLEQNA